MNSPEGGTSDTLQDPLTDPCFHGVPSETRALVDGVGVYTASSDSPFLTVPSAASPMSAAPQSAPNGTAGPLRVRLAHLEAPLRQQICAFPLRTQISDEEVSGLVDAVLDLMARHLPLASDAAHATL